MRWTGILIVAGAALSLAACSTYPAEPRYPIRPVGPSAPPPPPGSTPPASETWSDEPPPPARAPVERIDGGALPPPATSSSPTQPPAYSPPASGAPASLAPGAAYVIQPGDTISGVGRRFQTPVQVLIDLNGLGPRGAIASGQRIILPDSAVDTGPDPYAAGASPVGVLTPNDGAPPPPPPPSGNTALPPPPRSPATAPQGAAPLAPAGFFQWPVRGDIVRRFGPVGLGERNNGVNIAAPAGTEVRAAAAGRVAYVGDDLVGQGLTVLIVHRDGWRTVYGHLGSSTVRDGDDVRQGQAVGTVGLTAGDGRPSMHFETRNMRNDEPVPIDPLTVLPR